MPSINSPTPDATTTTKGKLQLAGDLSGTAAAPTLATGIPIQMVLTNYNAVATGTTTLPFDDTIPQNTEGTEFMTQTITPKSATSTLVIEVSISFSHTSASGNLMAALFQDSTVDAIAAIATYQPTATAPLVATLTHKMTSGTTSPTTFKVRAGSSAAGTMTFNGQSGARYFGGITMSSIKITEVRG